MAEVNIRSILRRLHMDSVEFGLTFGFPMGRIETLMGRNGKTPSVQPKSMERALLLLIDDDPRAALKLVRDAAADEAKLLQAERLKTEGTAQGSKVRRLRPPGGARLRIVDDDE